MRKLLFYLTNSRLTAYRWEGRVLSAGLAFEHNENGWEKFSTWTAQGPRWPAHLLVDLIEEDFQRDTVPHVLGKARAALLERRLNQSYRDTPYRRATLQGREKDGRRDDRVLFSALTNATQIKPWTDVLLRHDVPLVGIHSVSLLGASLPARLGLDHGAVLLVVRHECGLRQTFLHDGQLYFSRLTPLTADDPQQIAKVLMDEIAKIRQFLASTRQLGRDQPLQVAIVADRHTLGTLEAAGAGSHQLVPLDELVHHLGLKTPAESTHADTLYLLQVCTKGLAPHYVLPAARRFYRLWQTRLALNGLSVITLAAATLWTASNLLSSFNAVTEMRRLEADAAVLAARQQAVLASMPETDIDPHEMKLAVDLEELIARNAPSPLPLVGLLGRALEAHPEIRLQRLYWRAGNLDAAGLPGATAGGGEAQPVVAADIGIPEATSQQLLIEGEVVPFDKDYRRALDSVNRFAVVLAEDPRLKVGVDQAPLDVKSAGVLSGEAGREDAEAKASFVLKLSWNP